MHNSPSVSIVVPAFNAEKTLSETLESIRGQTFQSWECLVVDDGSTDDTAGIANSFCRLDNRFRLVTKQNGGTASAYNAGVRLAQSQFISICSADDTLMSEHVSGLYESAVARSEYSIFFSNGYYLRLDGSRTVVYKSEQWESEREFSFEEMINDCLFGVGALYHRTLFERLDGYREDIYGEDWDFWLRGMMQGARVLYIPQTTAVHRRSEMNKSADLVQVYKSDIRILRSLLRQNQLNDSLKSVTKRSIRKRRKFLLKEIVKDTFPPLSKLKVAINGE